MLFLKKCSVFYETIFGTCLFPIQMYVRDDKGSHVIIIVWIRNKTVFSHCLNFKKQTTVLSHCLN